MPPLRRLYTINNRMKIPYINICTRERLGVKKLFRFHWYKIVFCQIKQSQIGDFELGDDHQ